jgi:protein MpaA
LKKFWCVPALAAVILSSPSSQAATTQPYEWCKRLSARLASVPLSTCEKSGLVPTGVESHHRFPILMRSVPASGQATGKPPRILLIGGIHGDELTSVSIVFQWLPLLETPKARRYDWHIVPLVNPDGLFAPEPQRVNARGVDLNRNFPTPPVGAGRPRLLGQDNRPRPASISGDGTFIRAGVALAV